MKINEIMTKAADGGAVTADEALHIYLHAPTGELMTLADGLRRAAVPDPGVVTWQIDRNVNITNVCISGCKFCNFHCKPHEADKAYVTSIDQYADRIDEMLALGGDQLLLQGGLHPALGVGFYEDLFRELKRKYPSVKLHALGPPEVAHIAKLSSLTIEQTLHRLVAAGLDSLPGAGAEILDDGVRRRISPGKPSAGAWAEVMRTAHRMGLATSATMMYGHVETPRQRMEHLVTIRDIQDAAPSGAPGFVAFIPWIYRGTGTALESEGVATVFSPLDYIRIIAMSRIVLHNVPNIQASWLTVGEATAQMALHAGANDMGSIMIEERVVASAGAHNTMDAAAMRRAIRRAGFRPRLRDQRYNYRDERGVPGYAADRIVAD